MMHASTWARGLVALALIVGLGSVMMEQATAVPPPPRFHHFTVVNSSQVEVRNIEIELDLSDPTDRGNIMNTGSTPYGFSIWRLPAGRRVTVDSGSQQSPTSGYIGAARIRLKRTAVLASGERLQDDVVIEARKADFDPAAAGEEWAGFSSSAPQGQTDYPMTLEIFRNPVSNNIEARLHGKWRWDGSWPSNPVMGTAPFVGGEGAEQQGGG